MPKKNLDNSINNFQFGRLIGNMEVEIVFLRD